MYSFANRMFHNIIFVFFPLAFISSVSHFFKGFSSSFWVASLLNTIQLAVCYFFIQKDSDEKLIIKEKQFLYIIMFIVFATRIGEIVLIKTAPASDFLNLYNGAKELLNGNFSIGISKSSYWYRYNFQLGYTFYLFLILKIFNTQSLLLIKAFNVLWVAGIILLVYKIAKEIFDEREARVAVILITFYIPNIFSTSIILNEHIANFFFFFGIYILVRKNEMNNKYYIVGLLFAIGHVMKKLTLIYLTATVLYLIINAIYKRESLKITLFKLIKIIATFILIVFLVSTLFINLGMTDRTLFKHVMPMWGFLVGSNYDSNGHIGQFEKDIMRKLYSEWNDDYERFNEEARKEIIRRISDGFPFKYLRFLLTKFYSLWGGADSLINWSVNTSQETKQLFYYYLYGNNLIAFGLMQLISIYFFGFIYILKENIKNKAKPESLFILISLAGFIAGFLLLENQTRYRYSSMHLLYILSAVGFVNIIDYIIMNFSKKVDNMNSFRHIKYLIWGFVAISVLLVFKYNDLDNLKIRNLLVNNQGNRYYFTLDLPGKNNNLSYAWYIYKDGKKIETTSYGDADILIKDINEEGLYRVKCFVKNNDNGSKTSITTDQFYVKPSRANFIIQKIIINNLENKYYFSLDISGDSEELLYAWYIYKDGQIIEKTSYSNKKILVKDLIEEGSYRVKCFVKDREGNKKDTIITDEFYVELNKANAL